ncbi:hypothetical protein [Sorangium sp. So ce1000]|uniref:hypothetical protein n=1 Tax=Sorangium sp. So ce1000 TaxID=3133325 RepID=UPI003F633871
MLATRTWFSARGFVRRIFADPPSWLDGLLSERAVRAFERAGARRDPSLMTDRNDMVRRLRALKLPVSKEILELEEAIGGLIDEDYTHGIFAQMKRGVGVAWSYQGTPLVSFSDTHRYVDANGRIYLTDDIALGGVIADSWQTYLERKALAMLDFESAGREHSLSLNVHWGGRLAEMFGATLLPECSDSRQRRWRSPDVRVTEREEVPGFGLGGTSASCMSLDPLVDALRRAAAADPPVVVHYARGEAALMRPPTRSMLPSSRRQIAPAPARSSTSFASKAMVSAFREIAFGRRVRRAATTSGASPSQTIARRGARRFASRPA